MIEVTEDLSTLTTIPKNTLQKLNQKVEWIICNSIYEDILKNEKLTKIDLGIGLLLIENQEEEIKYKFIPSQRLEQSIREVYIDKKNPLQLELEKTLANRIINTYKDFI